jgi:hypothetical protein
VPAFGPAALRGYLSAGFAGAGLGARSAASPCELAGAVASFAFFGFFGSRPLRF